jgi:hypothetical protein
MWASSLTNPSTGPNLVIQSLEDVCGAGGDPVVEHVHHPSLPGQNCAQASQENIQRLHFSLQNFHFFMLVKDTVSSGICFLINCS